MSYVKRQLTIGSDAEGAFQEVLTNMDDAIKTFLGDTSHPKRRSLGKVRVYRFAKKDDRHALLLKLAQIPSNLRAAKLLIEHGFLYEWSMVRRSVHETCEDIMFLLATHRIKGAVKLRERFLKSFYTEILEPDGNLPQGGVGAVPRWEVRKFLWEDHGEDVAGTAIARGHSLGDLMRGLYGADSAHIHGRAAAILQLYDPEGRRFQTDGFTDTDDASVATDSLWLLTYLCIQCFAIVGGNWYGIDYRDHIIDFAKTFRQATRAC